MIDFTVFEKKKKTETLPSNNQHCIEKKKKNAVAIWPVTGQGLKNTK